MGSVNTECPDVLHTSPFGNWGVTSNFGQKVDGHQFDGWCHNTIVCDGLGQCRTECRTEWYQWNSCTDNRAFRAPNPYYYNANNGTEQVSTTGINLHGSRTVDVPVACPADTNGDGAADTGGCAGVTSYNPGTNFMSIYELDPVGRDELIQSLYFPGVALQLSCGPLGCPATLSEWMRPIGYDSPKTPAIIDAEMRVALTAGLFQDRNNACGAVTGAVTAVSGATFTGPSIAPDSIASGFGLGFSAATVQATTRPLPVMLGGITVRMTDAAGTSRPAGIFFISPSQINFEVPLLLTPGEASVEIRRGTNTRWTGKVNIDRVAPGLFSANADGQGVAAALVVRAGSNGQTTDTVFDCPAGGGCVPKAIAIGDEPTYLLLFGTGIRYGAQTMVVIGGSPIAPSFAGSQGQYTGLDQVNVPLPVTLRGRGEMDVYIAVDGRPSNTLRIAIQ